MNYYTKLSLKIIALFAVAMLMSFVPDYFHDFFGDWTCEGRYFTGKEYHGYILYEGCQYSGVGEHGPSIHWGWRHWLWFAMGVSLFVIQCFNIFTSQKQSKP